MPDQTLLLIICAAVLAFALGWSIKRVLHAEGPPRRRGSKPTDRPLTYPRFGSVPDAADQLRTVMAAAYKPRPILSKRETRVFDAAVASVSSLAPDWRVMAQVSLGEVLSSNDAAAYAAINSKRADILIVDAGGWPKAAIEYQGAGHHRGTAAARDAVKKEALRRAGVAYIEITEGQTATELHAAIARVAAPHNLERDKSGSGRPAPAPTPLVAVTTLSA